MTLTFTTDLPAPTNLTFSGTVSTSTDYSWTAIHNYGDTRVEYRAIDSTTWQTASTVSRTTETDTVTVSNENDLYEGRVVAQTEHTTSSSTVEEIKLPITIDGTLVIEVTIDGDVVTDASIGGDLLK